METNVAFHRFVTEPLEFVTGSVLLWVDYWILVYDEPNFGVHLPNETGLCAVVLGFENVALRLFPGWVAPLRENNAYHVQADLLKQGRAVNEVIPPDLLSVVVANKAPIWQQVLFHTLDEVTVHGFEESVKSPQLIVLRFGTARIGVAAGYSGGLPENPILVGDGDELLVFAYEQLPLLQTTLRSHWIKMYDCKA